MSERNPGAKRRYRIYVDESGDHTRHRLSESSRRYLGLTGCIFAENEYSTFHGLLEKLKERLFPDHHPDDPVILHRRDIMEARGAFRVLKDSGVREAFNSALLELLSKSRFTLITVVIDKKAHFDRYGSAAHHPYHYCLTLMLERYCGFLNRRQAVGDVMAESRGGAEDKKLKEEYEITY